MKCQYCGYENPAEVAACQQCGLPLTDRQKALDGKLLNMFGDILFWLLCVVCTLDAALPIQHGEFKIVPMFSMPLLWLIYYRAKRGEVDSRYLKGLSAAALVMYLVFFLLSILLLYTLMFSVFIMPEWEMAATFVLHVFITAGYGKVHLFAKSLYKSVEKGKESWEIPPLTAFIWMLVLTAATAASLAIAGELSFFDALWMASMLLSAALIKQYFAVKR